MREFETGATRDTDVDKYDYEGFFSPLVLARRAEYMHKHRLQADGVLRESDNWQKGMGFPVYMKSAWRHFMDWWRLHRSFATAATLDDLEEAICALMFNAEGYLHELLKRREGSMAYENLLVGEGLTGPPEDDSLFPQRKSPWWPEERFGQK